MLLNSDDKSEKRTASDAAHTVEIDCPAEGVPVTVTIFVSLPAESLHVEYDGDHDDHKAAEQALLKVMHSDEHVDAMGILAAAVAMHRREYPHSHARITPWLGLAADEVL